MCSADEQSTSMPVVLRFTTLPRASACFASAANASPTPMRVCLRVGTASSGATRSSHSALGGSRSTALAPASSSPSSSNNCSPRESTTIELWRVSSLARSWRSSCSAEGSSRSIRIRLGRSVSAALIACAALATLCFWNSSRHSGLSAISCSVVSGAQASTLVTFPI
jgi:hypothetical protein